MARFFIDRPVFAWVIAIFLMVAGALSLTQIPVSQYPTIASPAINVRVVYPGATAETLHLMVTDLIGQELNGIEGLRYYEISNEANGRATITATFVPGTNQDLAAVDVQNRIKRVEPKIPEEVKQQGIQIDKANSGFLCMVGLYSPDGSRNNFDIGDFAARNVYNEIKRVPGVGTATLLASEKAMRIWVDPAKLTGLGLSFAQVNAAVREQNAQIPAGILGLRPSPRYTQNTITLVAHGQLLDAKQFENILLRSNPDGSAVRLKDVARVELGAAEYGFSGTYIGKPAASIIVQLSPTANALATAKAVRATLEKLRPYFPKTEKVDAGGKRPQVQRVDPYSRDVIKGVDGKPIVEDQLAIDYAIPYDTSPFINVSIMAVVRTLIEAVALVFVVMFLFLQNIRYTFIPIIVVPVAILGAFAVLLALGFSVNVMTMFGMVLVIGILVDDAIVVVENVERIMREERLPAREATRKAMRQITGAIVGMTLVLASVFIPMAFFPGAVGIIYRQFSLTMVAAILFSALLALSLTPALCANILKPHAEIHGTRVPLLQRIGLILSAFIVAGVSIFLTYHAPWFDTAAHWLGARLGSAVSPVELFENTEVFLRTAACILFLVGVRDLIHSLIFAPLFEGTRATPPVRVLFFIIGVALAAAVFFIGNLAGVFTDAFGDAHGHLVLQIARVLLIFAAVYFLFVALRGFQRVFETLTSAYTATTRIIVRGAFVMMVAYAAIVYGFTHFYAKLPTSFVPQEDNGTLLNLIQMPAGTSANRTTEAFNLLQKHYNSDPAIKTVAGVVGFSLAGAGENAAMMFVTLQPWGVRDAEHGRKAYNAALEDAKKRDDKATLAYLARFGDDTWKNSLARTVHDVTGWEKPFGIEPKPAPFSPGDYLSSAQVAARAQSATSSSSCPSSRRQSPNWACPTASPSASKTAPPKGTSNSLTPATCSSECFSPTPTARPPSSPATAPVPTAWRTRPNSNSSLTARPPPRWASRSAKSPKPSAPPTAPPTSTTSPAAAACSASSSKPSTSTASPSKTSWRSTCATPPAAWSPSAPSPKPSGSSAPHRSLTTTATPPCALKSPPPPDAPPVKSWRRYATWRRKSAPPPALRASPSNGPSSPLRKPSPARTPPTSSPSRSCSSSSCWRRSTKVGASPSPSCSSSRLARSAPSSPSPSAPCPTTSTSSSA